MREIKFRAWGEKRMLNRTLFDRNWYTEDDKCVRGAMPNDARALKVMQYTGLKDAKGVEIYEGDILLCDNQNLWVVSFDDRGCFCATDHKYKEDWVLVDDYDFKVIGNIYENPELLK